MNAGLLFVVGPTASGKSDLAIEIAERTHAEILNCDSIQFFKGVDIGAAKPPPKDLARVPHHLVSHLELGAEYTAGDFRRDALRLLEPAEKNFVAVGGSGFYIQALEKGMYEVPPVAPSIREKLEAEMTTHGSHDLHRELSTRDAESGAKIDKNDRYRILRALELLRSEPSGKTLSQMRKEFEAAKPPPPFRLARQKVGLTVSREKLRERVTLRTRKMIEAGLIEEVERLRAQGFGSWAPMMSVGYKETQSYLDGTLPRAELEPLIVTSTMQLAKRQMTWFKRDTSIRWFDAEEQLGDAIDFGSQMVFQTLET
jgi:tRNA dimethylallyltransferase